MLKRVRGYVCISMMLLPAWLLVAAGKGQLQSMGALSAERPMLAQHAVSPENACNRDTDLHLAM